MCVCACVCVCVHTSVCIYNSYIYFKIHVYVAVDLNFFICKRPFFAKIDLLSRIFREPTFFFHGVVGCPLLCCCAALKLH